MRFTKKITEKIAKDMQVEDFREDSILRMIAEKDMILAIEVMAYFGGSKEYIATPVQVCTNAIAKYIKREKNQCKTTRLIALELGLTIRQMTRFKSFDDGSEEPLPDIPE
jgi:hypothetical protein